MGTDSFFTGSSEYDYISILYDMISQKNYVHVYVVEMNRGNFIQNRVRTL